MSTAALYKLSALSTPAGLIPSLMDRDLDLGLMEYVLHGDGKVSPEFSAVMHARPTFRATTVAIAAALTAMSSSFYPFSAAVDLYIAKLVTGGGLSAGSTHSKLTGTKGCIIPRRISVEHKREATLDIEGYFLSTDGTTAPLTYSGSVSLPVMAVASESFTLGLGSVNGTALAALKRLSIDFGFGELLEGSSGELYDTFGCYEHYVPRISFTTDDPTLVNTIGPGGAVQGGTPSKFFLQKLAPTGRVAAATTAHIKFALTAGYFKPVSIRENDRGQTEIDVDVINLSDGTNPILAITNGIAMS